MYRPVFASFVLAAAMTAVAQQPAVSLPSQTTLPVVFTTTLSADKAHDGDAVIAKTMQAVRLADGTVIRPGARVHGHVAESSAFAYDKTPYAKQKNAVLSVKFDSVEVNGQQVPLRVTVRAMADYYATNAAYEPKSTDLDPKGTLTLVGGELMTPSESEVTNLDGDVVAYNRRDGVYAHLIANGRCDGGDTEVSMGIYSATACGLYGYTNVTATSFGTVGDPSTLTLVSHRSSPSIAKHSTALLEVLPQQQASVAR